MTISPPKEQTLTASQSFWKALEQVPDGDRTRMCLQCGTCAGICPLGPWLEYPPRKLIHALRMDELDDVLTSDSTWMCVSCFACAEVCPQDIPTTALMVRLKEEMLLNGQVPAELQLALENTRRYGNVMGESPKKRADWAAKIDPPVPVLGRDQHPVEVLWYVGDYASYHPQAQIATRALVKVLRALGIEFGILGPDEVSDGDSQRQAGENGLFEWLATRNGSRFSRHQFERIITTDPHAYNALKNGYPALKIDYPVQHYTEFLYERIDQLRPLLKREVKAAVAYHDPCYLGRVNGIYDAPRELLWAIPGLELVELSHHHGNSLCCGGGGGGMWLDGFQWEKSGERISEWRMREVVAGRPVEDFLSAIHTLATGKRGAQANTAARTAILAVACPYEKPRFADAAKNIAAARQVEVLDIAELLVRAMD